MALAARHRSPSVAFTLIELLVIIGLISLLIGVLIPIVGRVRSQARLDAYNAEHGGLPTSVAAGDPARAGDPAVADEPARAPTLPPAVVHTFEADVSLTPRLSVGTLEPESIYAASFDAKLTASAGKGGPAGASAGAPDADREIRLPLPPQVVSLSDLVVTVNDQPAAAGAVAIAPGALVWRGPLPADAPAAVGVTYTAVGRGLYELRTPPGEIVDRYLVKLTANGSDVRMLELSMQPTRLVRTGDATVYTWDYKNLLFGRPIALDVLGIAPVDRLGELRWLAPMSIAAFGLVVGLLARAHPDRMRRFDRWMLLLVVGTFAAAYPLMYFAQEFMGLNEAIATAGGVVLGIIAIRSATILGVRLGLAGVATPAAIMLALTLAAATRPQYQGILLTLLALGLFVFAMLVAPKLLRLRHSEVPTLATA